MGNHPAFANNPQQFFSPSTPPKMVKENNTDYYNNNHKWGSDILSNHIQGQANQYSSQPNLRGFNNDQIHQQQNSQFDNYQNQNYPNY